MTPTKKSVLVTISVMLLVEFVLYGLYIEKHCIDKARSIASNTLNIDPSDSAMSVDDLRAIQGLDNACLRNSFWP